MSELSVKASFEYVLIETNAKAAGTEIVSPSDYRDWETDRKSVV